MAKTIFTVKDIKEFLSQNNLFRCLLKYPPNEWHDKLTERAFIFKVLSKETEEETDETETDENSI